MTFCVGVSYPLNPRQICETVSVYWRRYHVDIVIIHNISAQGTTHYDIKIAIDTKIGELINDIDVSRGVNHVFDCRSHYSSLADGVPQPGS